MAAPTPSTSSPLSAIETPPTVGALSSILSPTEQQLLSPLPISPLLSSAISGASTSSSPSSGQSMAETIVGYIAAALLVVAGLFVAVAGSPRILKVAGAAAVMAA